MRMHDSGRNLWPQDLALIPPVTPPNPLRFEALILIKSWDETDRVSPKTEHFPRLRALQIKPANENNSGRPHNSMAPRRSPQLNGWSHTRSTNPSTHRRFARRHTIMNLQTTTSAQMVSSHGLIERLERYEIQDLTYLSSTCLNKDIVQHFNTLIFKCMETAS